MFFEYPKATSFGRKIPKSKFYENAKLNTKLKDKFINQIDKIVWQYKLASNTLNLDATKAVPEIQILDLFLKTKEVDLDILTLIDKAIPLPIIFQIHYEKKIKIKATYKRPSESNSDNWVFDSYIESHWEAHDVIRQPLPQVLNLEKLYESLLTELIPVEFKSNEKKENIGIRFDIIKQAKLLKKDIETLNMKYKQEKQRNRQFDINKQIKLKQKELDKLNNRD
jgi:hypothetical protein